MPRSDDLIGPDYSEKSPPISIANSKIDPLAIDLFSGCGGATEGLKSAGFAVYAAVEIDANTAECYRANHPEVSLQNADIRSLAPSTVWRLPTPPDLIAACPPCQGFSALRTLRTTKPSIDSRNTLYLDFLRFVDELNPKSVLLENVPPFAAGGRFRYMLARLSRQGYRLAYRIVDASDYGVPQRRKRLIVVGTQLNIEIDSMFNLHSNKLTVREVIPGSRMSLMELDALHGIPQKFSELTMRRIRSVPAESTRKRATGFLNLSCHVKTNGFHDVYGRMKWDEPAPTVTSGIYSPSKGRFLHPIEDRCISLREGALLQGFPETYFFPVGFGKMRIASMIGNAAPPPLIAAFARGLR